MKDLTIQQYLQTTGDKSYCQKVAMARKTAGFPKLIKKAASHLIWDGPLRHMRHFNHDYSFTRNSSGLATMRYKGDDVTIGVPVGDLLGKITRPIALATSGPSAKEYDWQNLRQSEHLVIGVTGGATFLRERGIVPDLLVVTDPDFCQPGGHHVRDATGIPLAIEFRSAVALHTHFPDALANRQVSFIERVNKWYAVPALSHAQLHMLNDQSGHPFAISDNNDKLGRIGWSDRVDLGFYPSATVAFVALQVLVALGATNIEIIGMDLGGDKSIYANARPSKLHENYQHVILPSFEIMRDTLKNRSVSITNLSPSCPLPKEIFLSTAPPN